MSDSPLPTAGPRCSCRGDLVAAGVAWAVAFGGYMFSLAPGVMLDESGEFLTAAYHLGVPHPPGYPLWTILAWLWCHLIPFGNIAWRVNLMSAFCGASACGLAAWLIAKSGQVMARKVQFLQAGISPPLLDLIVTACAVSAALILAFSPVMWSQSVITGVHSFNACCLMATLVMVYWWSSEPERLWRLYLAAFIWGVALTSYQTVVLLAVPVPLFIRFVNRRLGRDVLVVVLVGIIGGTGYMVTKPGSWFHQGPFSSTVVLLVAVGAGTWLYFLWREGPGLMKHWTQVLGLFGAVAAGLSLCGYLYASARTNPPMNWGHCSQWENFRDHLLQTQSYRFRPERNLLQAWGQLNMFFDDLQGQFNVVFALFALLALFFFRDLNTADGNWLKFLLVGFLWLGLGFIVLANPLFEKQPQAADRVFFLPCHLIYTLWVGYGLILGLGYLFTAKPKLQSSAIPVVMAVALLPVVSIARNWAGNEKRRHDFGCRFGYLMFEPGGGYPKMEPGAILFGGTDPGRFVPTYLIFVESLMPSRAKTHVNKCPSSETFDRRDVYIITQNALAAGPYLASIRDHYDRGRPNTDSAVGRLLGRNTLYPAETIWLPSDNDSQVVVQKYVQELRSRPAQPDEEVSVEGGRVRVGGLGGVMAINGYLSRMIFENNKAKHACYVEESYAIPWMYPYLEPYGIILKLNPEPLAQITPEMVERDTAYWKSLVQDLQAEPKFQHDYAAQKTFAKCRAAIAGLYAHRRMFKEAEAAYQQAVKLCPSDPESSLRLAQLYVELGRFDDANRVLEDCLKRDRYNSRLHDATSSVKEMRRQAEMTRQLEQQLAAHPDDLPVALQLARQYAQRQRIDQLDALVSRLTADPGLAQADFLQLANFYAQLNRVDMAQQLLTHFTERYPQNPLGWYNLALVHGVRHECLETITALERAVAADPSHSQMLKQAREDRRFDGCRTDPRFERLLRGAAPNTSGLPFAVGH